MEILDIVVKAMDDKLASDIKIIDFDHTSPFYDYFVIGTCLNEKMAKAIAANIVKVARENNIEVVGVETSSNGEWTLIDLDGIVCHVFSPFARSNYNLERLWGDLKITEANV